MIEIKNCFLTFYINRSNKYINKLENFKNLIFFGQSRWKVEKITFMKRKKRKRRKNEKDNEKWGIKDRLGLTQPSSCSNPKIPPDRIC
jgi:hypothetical protein